MKGESEDHYQITGFKTTESIQKIIRLRVFSEPLIKISADQHYSSGQ